MEKSPKILQVLKDLILINMERVERYQKASYDIPDSQLKSVFSVMANRSRKNITEITMFLWQQYNTEPVNEVGKEGKANHYWMDTKSTCSDIQHNNLLNSFEFGELAELAEYSKAKSESEDARFIQLIEHQEQSLKDSLHTIRSYKKVYDKTGI